jgi:hypothetical protein
MVKAEGVGRGGGSYFCVAMYIDNGEGEEWGRGELGKPTDRQGIALNWPPAGSIRAPGRMSGLRAVTKRLSITS